MPTATIDPTTDRRWTAEHRALRVRGDYPAVATELVPDLGPALVRACGIGAGRRVLDVAAGTGGAALSAARAGADVVASDRTAELLVPGRRLAAERELHVDWREADAEALPFPDGSFDAVLSCAGAVFDPHRPALADEMLRVCRPGGIVGMVAWTPDGLVGSLAATLAPFASPLLSGAPWTRAPWPPRWGGEEHVRGRFAGGVTALTARRRTTVFDRCATPLELRESWKRTHGPTIAAYAAVAGAPRRTAALDAALLELLEARNAAPAGWPARWEAEYLLVTATRA